MNENTYYQDNLQAVNVPAPEVRPSRVWYLVAILVLVGGIGIGVAKGAKGGSNLFSFIESLHNFLTSDEAAAEEISDYLSWKESFHCFPAPGETEVEFNEPGQCNVYLCDPNPKTIEGFSAKVFNAKTGKEIPSKRIKNNPNVETKLTFNNVEYKPILKFNLSEPTSVKVVAQTSEGDVTAAVGPHFAVPDFLGSVGNLFVGIGAGVVGFILALVIFIVVLKKRSSCKRIIYQQQQDMAMPPIRPGM